MRMQAGMIGERQPSLSGLQGISNSNSPRCFSSMVGRSRCILRAIISAALLLGGICDAGASGHRVDADLYGFEAAVLTYVRLTGVLPTGEDGFRAMVTRPDSLPVEAGWVKMFESVPHDPWGNEYRYLTGPDFPNGYGIYSLGPDGYSETQGNDVDDWNSWREDHRGSRPTLPDHQPAIIGVGIAGVLAGFLLGSVVAWSRKHTEQGGARRE